MSTTLDSHFCISALDEAIRHYGTPEIFNTDQGCQFTSEAFVGRLEFEGIRVSMDGKGRAKDNIVVERFWRSLKYDEVYLKDYESVVECRENLRRYIRKYNDFRPHETLKGCTPSMAYAA